MIPADVQPCDLWAVAPIAGVAYVTSPWMPNGRDNPTTKEHDPRPHKGIDLRAALGTPVLAPGPGKVWLVDPNPQGGEGRALWYETKLGKLRAMVVLMHLDRTDLVKESALLTGDVLAYTGGSGHVTGPHLHLEVWLRNRATGSKWHNVDPVSCWRAGIFTGRTIA